MGRTHPPQLGTSPAATGCQETSAVAMPASVPACGHYADDRARDDLGRPRFPFLGVIHGDRVEGTMKLVRRGHLQNHHHRPFRPP